MFSWSFLIAHSTAVLICNILSSGYFTQNKHHTKNLPVDLLQFSLENIFIIKPSQMTRNMHSVTNPNILERYCVSIIREWYDSLAIYHTYDAPVEAK
jgi:hypothetical protein